MKALRAILQGIGALTVVLFLAGIGAMIFASNWMRVDDPVAPADFILPLAGDDNRLITAAELYRQTVAPVVLVSRARPWPITRIDRQKWKMGFPKYTRIAFANMVLGDLGVPPVARVPFGDGHVSTLEEAEAFVAFLDGARAKVRLVTSPYHARRAKLIFQSVLPDCDIRVTATPDQPFPDRWWANQEASTGLALEFIKTLWFLTGNSFRSTDASLE